MHPTHPTPSNGHAFNMYDFGYTVLYMYSEPNLTAAPKWKKPTWICVQQGWVLPILHFVQNISLFH